MKNKLLIIVSIISAIVIVTLTIVFSSKSDYYHKGLTKQEQRIIELDSTNNLLNKELFKLKDSLDYWKEYALSRDVINGQLQDSLEFYKEDAFIYKYKIERIKAYDEIVRKNSSQSKYFLGWVRRVLED